MDHLEDEGTKLLVSQQSLGIDTKRPLSLYGTETVFDRMSKIRNKDINSINRISLYDTENIKGNIKHEMGSIAEVK